MLQAESAEIGALQQCPRDGRRIVPTETPSATGGSRFSSSSADLLRRPPEARAVAPQAMQDDRQLAGERDSYWSFLATRLEQNKVVVWGLPNFQSAKRFFATTVDLSDFMDPVDAQQKGSTRLIRMSNLGSSI